MDILKDVEKAQVERFYNNEVMREAVKKVLLAGVYQSGTLKEGKPADPTRNAAFSLVSNVPGISNDQLGADLGRNGKAYVTWRTPSRKWLNIKRSKPKNQNLTEHDNGFKHQTIKSAEYNILDADYDRAGNGNWHLCVRCQRHPDNQDMG